jgi:hypothetical protein
MKKKSTIKIKNISKQKSDDLLHSLLEQLVAEAHVDPESVVFLSKLLSREVKSEKSDTREYNNTFVSRLDTSTMHFMDVGLKNDVNPGDGVKVTAWLQKQIDKNPELANYLERVIKEKKVISREFLLDPIIPFCGAISDDIGTKFILRSEQMDTFMSVLSEIEENRSKFINEKDWADILAAIKLADKRIKKESIIFLAPVEEGIIGTHRELTSDEKIQFGFDPVQPMDADFRKDDHDLISLKELAHVMRGNTVDYLSPFAGAFLKYMPELNSAGIRGIVFEVVDDKLNSVQVSRFDGKSAIPYGPTEAAIAVAQCFPELKTIFDLKHNVKFYVSVSGFICAPEDIKSWGYTNLLPKLNKAIPAGETILFHFIGDSTRGEDDHGDILVPAATRIYFYPYKPSDMHPAYQKMMVLYGQSDNMFHSCGLDPAHKFFSQEYVDELMNWSPSLDRQPASKFIYRQIMEPVSKFYPPGSLFYEHTKPIFGEFLGEDLSNAFYGENEYTPEKYLWFAQRSKDLPNEEANRVKELSLLNWVMCLPSAFLLYEYMNNQKSGLSTKSVFTTFHRLRACDTSKFMGEMVDSIKTAKAYKESNDEVKNGADFLESAKKLWKKLGR